MSCLYFLPNFHKVLCIMSINGFKTIMMANNNHIAMTRDIGRQANGSVKHSFHSIALLGFNLKVVAFQYSFTYWQRERIFFIWKLSKINVYDITLGKETWCWHTNLLLFGGSKFLTCGRHYRQRHHQCHNINS